MLNHTATRERLGLEIARAIRERQSPCFAVTDLDRFKAINDTHGHQAGDRVPRTLTDLLRQRPRSTDAVALLREVCESFSNMRQFA